ncbi:zinc knuckle CX2CX4HX4C containing protein [Tanacetum coccineum]
MFVNTSMQRGFFTTKGRGSGIFVKEKGLSMDDGHDLGNGGEASGFVTSNVAGNGVDVHLPKEPVSVVNERLNSIVYGFFLGKRMAYRVVENYVKITWGKFGLVKSMMIKDMHFFKFNSKEGMEAMLESGPWLIRNVSLTLKQWTLDANIIKDDVCNIPVWVKFHVVPITAFTKDGLSAIATKLGSPLMLYYYTNLLFSGEGFTTSTIYVEYEWTPPRFSECKHGKPLELKVKNEASASKPSTSIGDQFIESHDDEVEFPNNENFRYMSSIGGGDFCEDDIDFYDGYEAMNLVV